MKDNPDIRIRHLNILDHLIIGIADRQIKEKDISLHHSALEFRPSSSWSRISDDLVNGNADGAFITLPIAMALFEAGLDIRVLMLTHRSGSMVVKKNTDAIHAIHDFRGKTVLVPSRYSVQTLLTHRLLSSAGLIFSDHDDPDADVVLETAPPGLMAELLENDDDNDIAGFCAPEPFGTMAIKKNLALKVCPTDRLWPGHPCSAFVLKNEILQRFPDAVEEITDLFIKTAGQIETGKNDRFFKSVQAFLDINLDKGAVRQLFKDCGICYTPDLLIPSASFIDTLQTYMADTMKIFDSKTDMTSLIDTSFIKAAGAAADFEN